MYKPEWLSKGAEELLERSENAEPFDVVIVGSGYGGAVAAARLAKRCDEKGKPLTVCVLERGREHLPRTFASRFSDLPGHVRFSRFDDPVAKGARDGLLDVRIGQDVSVLVANGLGGGSLINAGVAVEPHWDVFDSEWPGDLRDQWGGAKSRRRERYYALARSALETKPAETKLEKHTQFVKLATAWGLQVERADITVDPDKCVKCGDCATGCNAGARKTLSKTYLAKAWQHGADIYTGATVSRVEKAGGEWAVVFGLTTPSRPLQEKPLKTIRARNVILAAGALGSTEILMRSRECSRDLRLSDSLGERFSSNGDMLSALYGQNNRVNAAPKESTVYSKREVGPTITGIARHGTTRKDRVVIEELAIPAPLRRVFEEVVTTSAMLESFGRADDKDHTDSAGIDPVAVNPDIVDNCQIFATMGDDGAKGRLELVPGWNDAKHAERANDGAIRIRWPDAGKHEIYKEQDRLLNSKTALGGTYLRNPLWRPFPDALAGALSGPKPTGLLFSMHPLGGCRMADDAEHGVVDQMGRVFSGTSGTEVHRGLLVLDGSVVPTALGINPLLTITAIAERAIKLYCRSRGWWPRRPSQPLRVLPDPVPIERRRSPRSATQGGEDGQARIGASEALTRLQLSERLTGEVRFAPGAAPMDAELTLKFEPVDNVPAFLRASRHELKILEGTLRIRQKDAAAWKGETQVRGSAELLVRGASTAQQRKSSALAAYMRLRGIADFRAKLSELGETWRREGFRAAWAELCRLPGQWAAYACLATHLGEIRYFSYDLTLESPLKDAAGNTLPAAIKIKGKKTFKYGADDPNPWRQLMDLKLTAEPAGTDPFALGTLSVDPAYFFRGFVSQPQIVEQRDLPASWMDLASLALFVARVILKIHFWSFRLPEYQKYDPMRDARRLPGGLPGLHMERHMVGYPETPSDAGVFLPLTRYRKDKDAESKPVLLIHGLGSGGIQFATTRVQPNLAQHLAEQGFDVWVAELRTSIALPYSLDQWTLDEVARGDIPRMVDLVLQKTGKEQVDIVAHCIGSAMFCTAVLDGKLQHSSGKSKISSAVLLQVGPLITLSKGTRLRGLVAAPLRRFLPDGHLDFSVDKRAGWVEALIDRVLSTYPYPPDEAEHHRLGWSMRRNAHIANCNRWAAIDGRMIRHDNLSQEMLDGLGEVLGHASITAWAQTIQYAFLERLTDSNARNSYVTTENVRKYFTFPVRFLHGKENDVFLPLTSWRSQELIQRIHGEGAAEVHIVPKYSHIDPLIGMNAERDVFRHISGFLAGPQARLAGKDAQSRRHYYARRPLIGPLLGWVRRDAETKPWSARIWCRIDDLRSPATCAVVFDAKGTLLKIVPCPTKAEPGKIDSLLVGPIDTTLCVDVELGQAPESNEIVVLSLHESLEQKFSEAHRQAENSAGKRPSSEQPHLKIPEDAPSLEHALKDPGWLLRLRRHASNVDPVGYDEKIDCATVPTDGAARNTLTFALASCRYPGWMFDRERADATFGALLTAKEPAPSALFLVGDQIYADATAGAFDPKDHRERFYEAYREAWTAPSARAVMSRLPVYMMLDDHEAGDNWHPEDFLDEEQKDMRRHGLEAYKNYQWIHSPGNVGQPDPLAPDPKDERAAPALYYAFELQGFPVFVCDTRSGRSGNQRILGVEQYKRLVAWLSESQRRFKNRPKFVVTPSVVVPFQRSATRPRADKRSDSWDGFPDVYASRSDSWDGFPGQLRQLLLFICREKIENVVFLSGDSHLSMASEIWFTENGHSVGPTACCIVASPMYAPYPFANSVQEQFLESHSAKLSPGLEVQYKVSPSSWAPQDSVTLVTSAQKADGSWSLTVRVRGSAGQDIATSTFSIGKASIQHAQTGEPGKEEAA